MGVVGGERVTFGKIFDLSIDELIHAKSYFFKNLK